jgi:glycosyltransferase involved in cell wall biosynthesis
MSTSAPRRLRVLTWHVHGNYLYNLSQVPHDFWLVTTPERGPHYSGRSGVLPWGDNVHEVAAEEVAMLPFDVVLYQHRRQWDDDRTRLLCEAQRNLPRIVLEHDPPLESPTDTRHWCDDAGTLIVHVTHFNALMWDCGRTPHTVIEHGVKPLAEPPWTGERRSGLVVVNNLVQRGRRLGLDLFLEAQREVTLQLVGMGSDLLGGAGNVPQHEMPSVLAAHRLFFSPIRHTSLGLAVVEALHAGIPVVALATTELASVIRSGQDGYVDTRLPYLVAAMKQLLDDPGLAGQWGRAGQALARERFSIGRFVDDWLRVLAEVTN